MYTAREPATKWERMALQDFVDDALERFYELARKLQYSAGMPCEDADRTAFRTVKGYGDVRIR